LKARSAHRFPVAIAVAAACAACVACSTIGDGGDGGEELPNAELGPFRELRDDELGASHSSPIALRDGVRQARDVSIFDADGDPSTPATFAYAAIVVLKEKKAKPEAPTDRIARYASDDGRTFEKDGLEVLAPTQPWESETISGPCAVRAGGEIRLYYASGGSIGLATSSDGAVFASRSEPVVRPFREGSTLSDPHVVEMPGGGQRMFVTVTDDAGAPSTIVSVASADGATWTKPESVLMNGMELRGASLRSPSALVATSPTGRDILHLYVEVRVGDEPPAIQLLSRFLDEPGWDVANAPVFAPRLGASSPEVRRITGADGRPAAMLFVSGPSSRTDDDWGISAAIAPGTAVLSPPIDRGAFGQAGGAPE
jgi:hypothetical protein